MVISHSFSSVGLLHVVSGIRVSGLKNVKFQLHALLNFSKASNNEGLFRTNPPYSGMDCFQIAPISAN
jgi:hypothetical protein